MSEGFKKFRHVHLVGSGGVGMFAIGGILLEQGICVSGSDLEKNSKSEFLRSKGAEIFYGHAAGNLPSDADALIYTSAASADNPEMLAAEKRGIPCFRRGQFLAEQILPCYERSAAVAGSHGKSTVSAMITHVLRKQNINTGCLIGGTLQDGSLPYSAGDGSIFVTDVMRVTTVILCCTRQWQLLPIMMRIMRGAKSRKKNSLKNFSFFAEMHGLLYIMIFQY